MATNNREQKYIFAPLKKNSEGRLKLQRIESSTGDGVPDIIGTNREGCGFWIESKFLDKWPVRSTTLPLKGSFEKGQLSFGSSWNDWNFHSFILVKVDDEGLYYLLETSMNIKEMNKDDLLMYACVSNGSIHTIIDFLEKL